MAHYGVKDMDIFNCYLTKVGSKNLDDMIGYIAKFGGPELEEPSSGKSEDQADKFLREGFAYYKKRNLKMALEMYNLSIRAALHPVLGDPPVTPEESTHPPEEEFFRFPPVHPSKYGGVDKGALRTLPTSYACRSFVLSDLQLYEQSLEDIELFFECGCPEKSKDKMLERRAKVIEQVEIRKSANQNHSNRDDSGPSESLLRPQDVELQNSILRLMKRNQIPTMTKCNASTPALSSALRISNIEGKGRGIVATRNISPGEVVAVERAYSVFTGDYDSLPTTCATCLYWTVTPVPCPGCSQVVFCSRSCRDKGLAEDHWLECRIQTSASKEVLQEVIIGCKMLKTFNHAHLDEMTQELRDEEASPCSPELIKGFSPAGRYSSSSYRSIHHLSCDVTTKSAKSLFALCLTSFRVAKMVMVSGRYFVDNDGRAVTPTREEFLNLCKRIVLNVEKTLKNAFGCGWPNMVDYSGVFPTVSLFNHSCNPALGYRPYGRHMVMFSHMPIKAGEEVTISYTDTFYQADLEARQENLRPYGFTCDCQACQEDWDFLENLPFAKLKCFFCYEPTPDEGLVCADCWNSGIVRDPCGVLDREISDMESTLDIIQFCNENIIRRKTSTSLDFVRLSQKIELLHRNLGGPCQAFSMLMSALYSWFL